MLNLYCTIRYYTILYIGLAKLSELPERSKRSKVYMTYLEDLEAYLLSFLQRTQPLVDLHEVTFFSCRTSFREQPFMHEALYSIIYSSSYSVHTYL
jgi:hypothetical protein